MPKDARDVSASLLRKGFQERKGDHKFYHLFVGDKKTTIFTKISNGVKEIPDNNLSQMAKQVKLCNRDFRKLVDCPLTQEAYLEILRENKHID